jgi:hypothetical protein
MAFVPAVSGRYWAYVEANGVATAAGIEGEIEIGASGETFNDVIDPSTDVDVSVDPEVVRTGDDVTWTITETNDGDDPLTDVFVELSWDGGASPPFAVLDHDDVASFDGGDSDDVLEPGETWTWTHTSTPPDGGQTLTATGHGTDSTGADVTYPGDEEERDDATCETVTPSTSVSISPDVDTVASGETVTWTVTETNDGSDRLTNVFVNIDDSMDDDDDGDMGVLAYPPDADSGNGDNALDPGETWTWTFTTNPTSDQQLIATGHATDSFGSGVTYPDDPDERASACVEVGGDATRTLGYWKTHVDATRHVLNVHLGGSMDIGWKTLDSVEEVLGMLWANPARDSDGDKRSELCHAKVQLAHQLVAALLNEALDNGASSGGATDEARAAMAANDFDAIKALAAELDAFNNSGDDTEITDAGHDMDVYKVSYGRRARVMADIPIADCE